WCGGRVGGAGAKGGQGGGQGRAGPLALWSRLPDRLAGRADASATGQNDRAARRARNRRGGFLRGGDVRLALGTRLRDEPAAGAIPGCLGALRLGGSQR